MNTDSFSFHPLQPLWNLAAAPMLVQALQQAIQLRLFEHLNQPKSAVTVAQTLILQTDTTAIWLDVLWSMGLLHRHAGEEDSPSEYIATDTAARYFQQESKQDCAAAWQARAEFLAGFSRQWERLLHDGISRPDSTQNTALQQHWAQSARTHLGQEQRAVSVEQVILLLNRLPLLPKQGRFADVGGGPGHVAVALAQHLPAWHGVLLEQAHTAAVAQETILTAGLEERLSSKACDLNNGEGIGSGYDLIWCSSVLHFVRDPQAAIHKMHAALKPGGRLLLAHAELSNDPQQAAQIMPFYAGVMLRGGKLPHTGDIAHWMQAAGFTDVRALGQIPWALAPLWVYTGRRV